MALSLPPKFLPCFVVFLAVVFSIPATNYAFNPPSHKAIMELKDAMVKALGLQLEDVKISGFDVRDAKVGHSVVYDFGVEVGKEMYPIKLLEDVSNVFGTEKLGSGENSLAVVGAGGRRVSPALAPFQLAGPMELWIQDGDDMRVSLPHDVDAGIVKKVMLAEGAVVTVTGARSVSLRHPLDLPLPPNTSSEDGRPASRLLTLGDHLRLASISDKSPLLSLRIVGPTSLTSPSSASPSKLKLKRLGPGLVELSQAKPSLPLIPLGEEDVDEHSILNPNRHSTLWPISSLDASSANLQGLEMLYTVLGDRAKKAGSFRLVKADVSAQTSIKMEFRVDKKIKEGDVDWSDFPEWRTKPEYTKMFFEVLGKLEGDRIVAEKVSQVPDPVQAEDTIIPSVLTGNRTMTSMPIIHPPHNYLTL